MFYCFITLQNHSVIFSRLSKALCSNETLETDYSVTRGHIREEGRRQPTPSLAASFVCKFEVGFKHVNVKMCMLFFLVAQHLTSGPSHLTVEVSRSHTVRHIHSVGLL